MTTARDELAVAVPDPACPLCGTPLQRTVSGDIADGLEVHVEIVHPDATKAQDAVLQRYRRRLLMDVAARALR